jgi:hypothetical protein
LKNDKLTKGHYFYFIYRLGVHAAQNRNTLETIIIDKHFNVVGSEGDAETIFGEMVERGENTDSLSYDVDKNSVSKAHEKASESFHDRINTIRREVGKNNDAFVDRRLESLRTSYGKNIGMKQDLLAQLEEKKIDERILRMHRSTINRWEVELREKERELESQRAIQVEFNELAAGILEVI